jgi:membrane protein DedA with SNARE-associated domain
MADWILGLPAPLVYLVVGLLVFLEDALFVGFVLPGETAALVGGFLASRGVVSPWWLGLVVVVGAVAGDSVGYEVGSRFGPRLLAARALASHEEQVANAQAFVRRHGSWAVFLGRFVAFFRAMMPALAGISHMPYRRFLPINALGGLVWGVAFTAIGYFAGDAYERVAHTFGEVAAVVIAVVVIAGIVVWRVRRRREDATPPG